MKMLILNRNLHIKFLEYSLVSSGGRNNQGVITIRNRARGAKKKFRQVDFFRSVKGVVGRVRCFVYDPNRNAFLVLVCYKNSFLSYLLASEKVFVGQYFINSSSYFEVGDFYSTVLSNAIVGSLFYNLELFPNSGGKFLRSAGAYGQLLKRISSDYVLVRLRSKEMRLFHVNCFFTYGIVSNGFAKFYKLYKASQNIFRGYRPVVRGEAKNPVDHPHGGNTSGGRPPMSPTGKLTQGVRTRGFLKNDSLIFKTRHVSKKR